MIDMIMLGSSLLEKMKIKIIIIISVLIFLIIGMSFFLWGRSGIQTNSEKNDHLYSFHLLSPLTNLRQNEQIVFRYNITDNKGTIVKDFAVDHEKLMHLIVVRHDLQDFQHLHPSINKNTGEFTIPVTFPNNGNYRLYADFIPANKTMNADPFQYRLPRRSTGADAP